MLKYFQTHIKDFKELDLEQNHFLLAISGGLDSVVLLDLFFQSGLHCSVAHCNFKLRAADSDADEEFVKKLALRKGLAFYSQSFETKVYAKKQKLSIQKAARDLRYEWLEQIRQNNQLDWIVTAHHLNDSLETFLYNFSKGTGIRGLLGVPKINGKIIRPLLPFGRKDLEAYYQNNNLKHREDASNILDKYARNKIRHHVVPTLETINPSLNSVIKRNFRHLQEIHFIFYEQIEKWKKQCLKQKNQHTILDYAPFIDHPSALSILFELLLFSGLNRAQVEQVLYNIQSKQQTGAIFYSNTHKLLIDRATLVIKKRNNIEKSVLNITKADSHFQLNKQKISIDFHLGQPSNFVKDPFLTYIDADKLIFPLTLRHWQAGDEFCPLGMKGKHKKIQDLFTDRKLNRFEKEENWILVNGDGKIAWVVGIQLDERFKITTSTSAYYTIKFGSLTNPVI